ncbi:MAG: hypothetical protein VKJ04_01075 [Vampirovibrionales bacterium]|nr:hypothetical protein [Vampirovibrionales bacterium]
MTEAASGVGSNLSTNSQPAQPPGEQGASQQHPWASDPWQNSNTLVQYQPTPYNYPGMIASQYAGFGLTGGYVGAYPGAYPPGGGLIPGAGGGGQNGLAGAYSPYAPTFSSLPISPLETIQGKYEAHKIESGFKLDSAMAGGASVGLIGTALGFAKSRTLGGAALGAVIGLISGAAGGLGFGSWFGEREAVYRDSRDDGRQNGSTGITSPYPYAHAYNPNNVNLAY